MRIGSLFSGAGGLDMAVEEVFGGEVIWQAEVDKAASKVLAYRFPCAPNLGDITQIDWKTVEPPDILCGGFPCQDVSAAGKRAGIKAGTRSGLWSVFADAIDQLRPPLVVIENVRGLLSAQAHRNVEPDEAVVGDRPDRPVLRALGAVLGDLADLGYDAQWTTVAASSVGAPHRRERVFILAHSKGTRRSIRNTANVGATHREVNAFANDCLNFANSPRNGRHKGRPESARIVGGSDAAVSGDEPGVVLLPTPRSSDCFGAGQHGDGGLDLRTTVTELAKESNAAPEGGPGEELRDMRDTADPQAVYERPAGGPQRVPEADALLTVMREQQDSDSGGQSSLAGAEDQAEGILRGLRHNAEPAHPSQGQEPGEQRAVKPGGAVQLMPQETALAGGPGVHGAPYSGVNWGRYEAAIRRWENVLGRPAPSPTEPNKSGNPRLAAEFSSWMMGWPPGWVTDPDIGISRNDQLKIIGNGVCPQQAIAALRYLLTVSEAVA